MFGFRAIFHPKVIGGPSGNNEDCIYKDRGQQPSLHLFMFFNRPESAQGCKESVPNHVVL